MSDSHPPAIFSYLVTGYREREEGGDVGFIPDRLIRFPIGFDLWIVCGSDAIHTFTYFFYQETMTM